MSPPVPPCQLSLLHRHRLGSVTTSCASLTAEPFCRTARRNNCTTFTTWPWLLFLWTYGCHNTVESRGSDAHDSPSWQLRREEPNKLQRKQTTTAEWGEEGRRWRRRSRTFWETEKKEVQMANNMCVWTGIPEEKKKFFSNKHSGCGGFRN